METPNRSRKYILITVSLVIAGWLIMNFNERMAELRRLSREKETVSVEYNAKLQTKSALETQIAFVTSEAGAVQKARQDLHMMQPGDVPVIPLPGAGSTPTPSPRPTLSPTTPSNWRSWLALFTGP